MQKEPPPFVWAAPDEKNILNCECLMRYHLEDLYSHITLQGTTSLCASQTFDFPGASHLTCSFI